MLTNNVLELQQSHGGPAVSGCWKLQSGRAISLQPHEAGVLRITHGQVWATLDGPRQGHGNELGDHFVRAGQQMSVGAGQHLVFEPWGELSTTDVYFEWIPVSNAVTIPASRWHGAVEQPLHDLGLALLMVGSALWRLATGLLGYGEYLTAGRGRVMPKLEANQP